MDESPLLMIRIMIPIPSKLIYSSFFELFILLELFQIVPQILLCLPKMAKKGFVIQLGLVIRSFTTTGTRRPPPSSPMSPRSTTTLWRFCLTSSKASRTGQVQEGSRPNHTRTAIECRSASQLGNLKENAIKIRYCDKLLMVTILVHHCNTEELD